MDSLPPASSISKRLLRCYQQGGTRALHEIQGSFSLILYDTSKQLTLLYRPFLNGLPLYFVHAEGVLNAASNPLDILSRNDLTSSLDKLELARIFRCMSTRWQETVFSEISAVKHGEMLLITAAGIECHTADMEKLLPELKFSSREQAITDYRVLLENAVLKQLQPGRQHAVMLSSGLDSSSLAVLANRHLTKPPLMAISWSLPGDKGGDESEQIAAICKSLKIPLHLFDGNSYGPFDQLEDSWLLPETPFTNPFGLITNAVYQHAEAHGVEVLLNGNFADVLIPGMRYIFSDILRDHHYGLLLPVLRSQIKRYGWRKLRKSPVLKGLLPQRQRQLVFKPEAWMPMGAGVYADLHKQESQRILQSPAYERFATALSPFQSGYPGMDQYLSGPHNLRRIEPHRDIELLNFSLRLPAYWHYRNGQMKAFIREALQGWLPENIRLQPRAGDLSGLVQRSFSRNRGEVRERLLDDPVDWSPYVDTRWMEQRLSDTDPINYRDALLVWQSLNLQSWKAAIKPGGRLFR
ncbi:MAG: asparagine synthase [Proteobacteria bacterium]|nr:asparagine synthase [Pseudomonadota bacterium]